MPDEFSHIAGGIVNWYNHIENNLVVPTRAEYMPTLWPSSSTPRYTAIFFRYIARYEGQLHYLQCQVKNENEGHLVQGEIIIIVDWKLEALIQIFSRLGRQK